MNILKYSWVFVLLCAVNTSAQNWLWVTNFGNFPSTYPYGPANSSYRVRLGPDHSVYVASINANDNIVIGANVFYDTAYYPNRSFEYGGPQAILTKYDLSGNVLWAKASNKGYAVPIDMATDIAGNVYFLGAFMSDSIQFDSLYVVNKKYDINPLSFNMALSNFFLVKFSPAGNALWINTGSISFFSAEARPDYLGYRPYGFQAGIAIDENSNVYIASSFDDTVVTIGRDTLVNIAPGKDDIFIAKYNSAGDVVWARSFGGSLDDEINGIEVNKGRICIAGNFTSPDFILGADTLSYVGPLPDPGSSSTNCYMAGFDTSGSVLWAKGSYSLASPAAMAMDTAGNVYVGGYAGYVPYMILCGDSVVIPTLGNAAFLGSVDMNGNTRWLRVFPQALPTYGTDNVINGIAIDACNHIWVNGGIDHTGGISLGTDTFILKTDIYTRMFIAEMDDSGREMSAWHLFPQNNAAAGIAADSFGNVFLASYYRQNPFTLGSYTMGLQYGEYGNTFLAKLNPSTGIDLSSITNMCPGSTKTLYSPQGYSQYYWSTNSDADSIIVNSGGSYIAWSYEGCSLKATDNFTVSEIILNPFVKDTSLCRESGNNILLDPQAPNGSSVLWNTNQNSASITISAPGSYSAIISENGCSVTDSFNVNEYSCNCAVLLPNVFTPNGDGKNDVWGVVKQQGCTFEKFALSIYNRWGNLIFKTDDPSHPWDGKFHDKPQDMGTYMYYLEYKTNYDMVGYYLKGTVTLVR